MLRAVLFDLDDTLFDHESCARGALEAVHRSHERFRSVTFQEFERLHAVLLEELHQRVISGELDLDTARIERFRRLFEAAGAGDRPAEEGARVYRECYIRTRRAIAGAAALLSTLKPRVKIGVVSNNLLAEQQEKMKQCGLDGFVDALIVSETVGVMKPDPLIFRVALEQLAVTHDETVMVGDSWAADVEGARAAGIPVVWFNRNALPSPEPAAGVPELRALEPVGAAIDAIELAHRRSRAHRH
jgi:HAD superfamily hydrolase (TIGR01509 family)